MLVALTVVSAAAAGPARAAATSGPMPRPPAVALQAASSPCEHAGWAARVGGPQRTAPQLVSRVPPFWWTRSGPAEGPGPGHPRFVIVEARVDELGFVTSACVTRGVRPDLDATALRAVARWRFRPMLIDRQPIPAITTLPVEVGGYPPPADARHQQALVTDLQSGPPERKRAAIRDVLGIPPDRRGSGLWDALREELVRLNDLPNASALREGQPADAEAAYYDDVVDANAQSTSPSVIEPLVEALEPRAGLTDAVAAFGSPALSALVDATGSKRTDPLGVRAVLLTLTKMWRAPVRHALSAADRGTIAELARRRLKGKQAPEVLTQAITLAVETGDPHARRTVDGLARRVADVRARGITAPDEIDQIRDYAAAALEQRPEAAGRAPKGRARVLPHR